MVTRTVHGMKLMRATCECGFYTRKARAGYHFHQWWFPVLNTRTGQLADLSCSLPDDQVDLIQFNKVQAEVLHQPFIESATQDLIRQCSGNVEVAFNPDVGSTFTCPRCSQVALRIDHVNVTAFCKANCSHEYQWNDSEQRGCPKCSYRPHRFRVDTDRQFSGQSRTASFCPCCSSMDSVSHLDAYCPKCGQLPVRYETNGNSFCGMHHERLEPYQAPGNFLFIFPPARCEADHFPNAKLFGEALDSDSVLSSYCPSCEAGHQRWLATEEAR